MSELPVLDEENARRLEQLLKRYSAQPEIQGYPEAAGFLFAITNGPIPMQPVAWMPYLLGEQPPEVDRPDDADALMDRILSLQDWTARDAQGEEPPGFPPGMELSNNPEDNIAPDAALSRWSRGFMHGMGVVAREWENRLPHDEQHELYHALMVMTAFERKEIIEELHADFLKEGEDEEVSFAEYLEELLEALPEAMDCYAFLGNHLRHLQAREEESRERRNKNKPGRNDPCPCGSGHKYKKCCGDTSVN